MEARANREAASGLSSDGDDTKRTPWTNCKGPALGLGQNMAVVFMIIAVGPELPPAMRQGAVLNDEIRRGTRRHLDRKGHRHIAIRNVPIPDRLDEVGNGGGGPDTPRKTLRNDLFAAPPGWLQFPLRKSDGQSRYHAKSLLSCGKNRRSPPKLSTTYHSAINVHLEAVRGFFSPPLLPLKHFTTRTGRDRSVKCLLLAGARHHLSPVGPLAISRRLFHGRWATSINRRNPRHRRSAPS